MPQGGSAARVERQEDTRGRDRTQKTVPGACTGAEGAVCGRAHAQSGNAIVGVQASVHRVVSVKEWGAHTGQCGARGLRRGRPPNSTPHTRGPAGHGTKTGTGRAANQRGTGVGSERAGGRRGWPATRASLVNRQARGPGQLEAVRSHMSRSQFLESMMVGCCTLSLSSFMRAVSRVSPPPPRLPVLYQVRVPSLEPMS